MVLAFENEHGEDGSESECDDDEDEHDQKDVERCTRSMQILTFKDVEESLNTFSGDGRKMFATGYGRLKKGRLKIGEGMHMERCAEGDLCETTTPRIGQDVR